jgi:hypothetical protein
MAASHPNMFRKSFVDESEILKLVDDHHLPPLCTILQWWPMMGEEIPTPNTNEIVVSKSSFERGFGLLARDFFHGLLTTKN